MSESTQIRLHKYLADAGLCSRRTAEEWIRAGEVSVNGATATIGQPITPGVDRVVVNGQTVRAKEQPKITVAVHKPRGLVCSNSDPHEAQTVFDLLPPELRRLRFFCAGRLDKDSEGLVILTTDGDLAHRLMHPASQVVKRYFVQLEEPFPAEKIPKLLHGVRFEDERLKVEHAILVNANAGSSARLDVHLHHGKKREIRQLFLALGYQVKRLRRYQIGAFPLRGIPVRAGKILQPRDLEALFRLTAFDKRRVERKATATPTDARVVSEKARSAPTTAELRERAAKKTTRATKGRRASPKFSKPGADAHPSKNRRTTRR